MPINPAFERNSSVSIVIGKILLSYGELEAMLARCLGLVLKDEDAGWKTIFRITGETSRVRVADVLMRRAFKEAGLESSFADMIGAVRHCVSLRNQYAHCQWADDPTAGLFFTNLAEAAKGVENFHYWVRHIDVALADSQLAYFDYAMDCLNYLETEFQVRTGTLKNNPLPAPPKLLQPSPHNPPEIHIPSWLTEDEKRRHIERARKLR